MKIFRHKAALAAASFAATAAVLGGIGLANAETPAYTEGKDKRVIKTTAFNAEASERYWTANRLTETEGNTDSISADSPSADEKPVTPKPHDRLGYGRPAQPYVAHYGTRQTGKVVFLDNGEPANCSGSSIGGDMIATAAHCVVNDDGKVHEKLAFIPAYKQGDDDDPFGTWGVEQAYFPTKYLADDSSPDDVAILRLARNGQGASLGDIIGNPLKVKISKTGAPKVAATYGYPAVGGGKFTGGEMFYCVSTIKETKGENDQITQFAAPGCAVQGGNSGGPVFDNKWNLIGVAQARAAVKTEERDGKQVPITAQGAYSRLHPENFGRLLTEAKADVKD